MKNEKPLTFNDKAKRVMEKLNGECEDITIHTVSPEWYRMNVDMYHTGDKPLEIVQCTYAYELYAMPNYMILDTFMNTPVDDIVEQWEI